MRRGLLVPALALVLVTAPTASTAGERKPVEVAAVRAALENTWAQRAAANESMEIVRVPALLAPKHDEILVTWPDPPLPPGPRVLTVEIRVDGRIVSRGLANVVIRRRAPVWILTRSVSRGDTLRVSDFRREDRVWDRPDVRALTGPLPARGFVARRALAAGHWVRRSDVRARPDVEAGADILLLSRNGEATVSIAATTRRSGFVGDTILVLNPLTGTVVRARLIDALHAELVSLPRSPERSAS